MHTWQTLDDWRTIVDGETPTASAVEARQIDAGIDRYGDLIQRNATKYAIPFELIAGVMRAESGYDPSAVSGAGAMGLMQVMPANFPAGTTRAQMLDPETNVDRGAFLLADAIRRFGRDVPKIAATYNAGSVYPWYPSKDHPDPDPWGYVENPGYIANVVRFTNYVVQRGGKFAADVVVELLGDSVMQGTAPEIAKRLPSWIRLRGTQRAYGVASEAVQGNTLQEMHARFLQTKGAADVEIWMGGTNNVAGKGGNWTLEAMTTEAATMCDEITDRGVLAQIVVAINPITKPELSSRSALVAPYNANLMEIATLRRAEGKAVAFVDPDVQAGDLYDGVHGGFAKIADAVVAKLIPIAAEIKRQREGGAGDGLGLLVAFAFIAWAFFGAGKAL